jgi:uncharacterized Zn finger protein (UPF0148 family)
VKRLLKLLSDKQLTGKQPLVLQPHFGGVGCSLCESRAERVEAERAGQAAKDQVGLDHYQVRRYDAWYQHVTLVLVAQAFLAAVRVQAGEGS